MCMCKIRVISLVGPRYMSKSGGICPRYPVLQQFRMCDNIAVSRKITWTPGSSVGANPHVMISSSSCAGMRGSIRRAYLTIVPTPVLFVMPRLEVVFMLVVALTLPILVIQQEWYESVLAHHIQDDKQTERGSRRTIWFPLVQESRHSNPLIVRLGIPEVAYRVLVITLCVTESHGEWVLNSGRASEGLGWPARGGRARFLNYCAKSERWH
jgi:hypothetical protein